MKRIISLLLLTFFALPFLYACSDAASDINVSNFETEVINKIPGIGEFKKEETDNSVTFKRDNVKYNLETSKDDYIKKLTVTVSNADKDYFRKLNYFRVTEPDSKLEENKLQSIHAVRYSAMALKLLCNMQDEDCIDTVLDARSKEIEENYWKLSFNTDGKDIIFTAVYTG